MRHDYKRETRNKALITGKRGARQKLAETEEAKKTREKQVKVQSARPCKKGETRKQARKAKRRDGGMLKPWGCPSCRTPARVPALP